MAQICRFRDFYSLSECRDLLFHVQEHRFSLIDIEAALNDLDLRFLGIELWDQGALGLFDKKFPESADRSSLRNWHLFEQEYPDTFRGMYQFWCRKGA